MLQSRIKWLFSLAALTWACYVIISQFYKDKNFSWIDLNYYSTIVFAFSFLFAIWLRTIRWNVAFLEYMGTERKITTIAYVFFFSIGAFTPFRSGEMLKVAWAQKKAMKGFLVAGAFGSEKLADALVLILFFALGLWLDESKPVVFEFDRVVIGSLTVFAISIILISLQYLRTKKDLCNRHKLFQMGLGKNICELLDGLKIYGKISVFFKFIIISMSIWSVIAYGFFVALHNMFSVVHFSTALLIVSLVNLSAFIGGAPGNIGVYEAIMVSVLIEYNIQGNAALSAAVYLHGTALIICFFCGIIGYVLMRRSEDSAT